MVIFDRVSGLWPPVDVRLSPKAGRGDKRHACDNPAAN
jgi:hypothetical protein